MSRPCLLEALRAVPDPRSRQGRSYPLAPILALLVVGILLGRRSPAAIAQLTDDYGPEFALVLGFPRLKIPTGSMLSKLLPRIDVTALEAVLSAWIAALFPPAADPAQPASGPAEPLVVNMDGKCSRGSAHRAAGVPGAHLLAAFAPRLRVVLAQLRVDAKTNEHKAALELLNILPRRTGGYIITGDPMFTQTEVCQAIRDRDDDYVLVVKENQHALAVDIEAGLTFAATAATFSPGGPRPAQGTGARAAVRAHHRQGPRSVRTPDLGMHTDPDGAAQVAGIEARVPGAPLGDPQGQAV